MATEVDLLHVQEPGYLVWNPQHGLPTVGHDSRVTAEREARRLADENPGHMFFILNAETAFVANTDPIATLIKKT